MERDTEDLISAKEQNENLVNNEFDNDESVTEKESKVNDDGDDDVLLFSKNVLEKSDDPPKSEEESEEEESLFSNDDKEDDDDDEELFKSTKKGKGDNTENKDDDETEDLITPIPHTDDNREDEVDEMEDLIPPNDNDDESEDLLNLEPKKEDEEDEDEDETEDLITPKPRENDMDDDDDDDAEDLITPRPIKKNQEMGDDDDDEEEETEDLITPRPQKDEEIFFQRKRKHSSKKGKKNVDEDEDEEEMLFNAENISVDDENMDEDDEEDDENSKDFLSGIDEVTLRNIMEEEEMEKQESDEEGFACPHLDETKEEKKKKKKKNSSFKKKKKLFFKFLQEKNLKEIKTLLENDPQKELINSRKSYRSGAWTPLIFACEFTNDYDIVKYLLETGADVEKETSAGCNALHSCCNKGNFEIFKLLLQYNCDVKKENMKKWNCLHFAAIGKNLDIVKYLVETVGMDVNSRTKGWKWTPLHFSCRDGDFETVKYLISKGADVNAREIGYNNTPVHAACFQGHFKILKFLVEECGCGILARKTKQNWTVLHFAVKFERYKIVQYLLDPQYQHHHRQLQNMSLLNKPDPNKKKNGVVEGIKNKQKRKRKISKLLLKEEEELQNIEELEKGGGSEDEKRKRLENVMSSIINAQTESGNTALHFAAQNKDYRSIRLLLLQKSVDKTIRNLSGKLPKYYVDKAIQALKKNRSKSSSKKDGNDHKNSSKKKKEEMVVEKKLSEEEKRKRRIEERKRKRLVDQLPDVPKYDVSQLSEIFEKSRKELTSELKEERNTMLQHRQKIDSLYHKLFKKKLFCNVNIKTQEGYLVPSHQIILARTEYLRKWMTIQEKPLIVEDEFPRPVIVCVLEWLYGRIPSVHPRDFTSIYRLATKWGLLYLMKYLVSKVVSFREDQVLCIAVEELDDNSPLFLQCLQYIKSHYIVYKLSRYRNIMKKNRKLFQRFKKLKSEKLPPALSHREFATLPHLGGPISSSELYGKHISDYCFDDEVRSKWGSMVLKSKIDNKSFRVHRELLAASSNYFLNLFIDSRQNISQVLVLNYHSFFIESLVKYVYYQPTNTTNLICLAMISKDFKLVTSESTFLEKLKISTTKTNLIDIVFKYGHLFLREESVVKDEIVGIIKNYYDESVIGKLIDTLVKNQIENSDKAHEIMLLKSEIENFSDKKREQQEENDKLLKACKEENEDLKNQIEKMKEEMKKMKGKIASFKALFADDEETKN